MRIWIKNTGQFHPQIAWVAKIEGELAESYRGCGPVRVTPGMTVLDYFGDEADNPPAEYDGNAPSHLPLAVLEATFGGGAPMASCHELSADHGTALAATLNVLDGRL